MLPFLIPLAASVVQGQMAKNQQEEPVPFVNSGNAMARRQQQQSQEPPGVLQQGLSALSQLGLPSEEAKKYAEPLLKANFKAQGRELPASYDARKMEIG